MPFSTGCPGRPGRDLGLDSAVERYAGRAGGGKMYVARRWTDCLGPGGPRAGFGGEVVEEDRSSLQTNYGATVERSHCLR